MKKFIRIMRKTAKFVLAESRRNVVNIELRRIDYGGILAGKKAVITGGGKGIGFAIAEKFVSEGAQVLIAGRDARSLECAVGKLGGSGYLVFDTTDVERADDFVKRCYDRMDGVDILVNNAGISLHEGNFMNVTIDGFDRQFDTNLKAHFFLAKSFLERKLSSGEPGNILFISSNTSAQCFDIPYGLSKAAINSLTGALSRRVYKNGIRVNAICPGVVPTGMTKDFAGNGDGNMYFNTPSGRLFLPEEIAEVACFLASDASKCISGEVLFCDAGNHLNVNW